MGNLIHRKDTQEGPRYRLWCTNTDFYVSDEMTRDGMVQLILDEDYGDPRRLDFVPGADGDCEVCGKPRDEKEHSPSCSGEFAERITP